jgi:tRNA dimethylallyltransferase
MPDIQYHSVLVGLRWERGALYRRIDARVDAMLEDGLLEEARGLLSRGESLDSTALNTVGYKEAFSYLRGELDLPAMTALIKQHSRNYAKRQETWFRRESRIRWYDVASDGEVDDAAVQMAEYFLSLASED